MENINIDRLLAIAGLVAATLSILLAYYFYRKTVRTKILAIAYTGPVPLVLPIPGVTASYLGNTVTELSRVFVLLWNKGTAPIETQDFLTPITLKTEKQILALEIYDKDAAATATVNPQDRSVSVQLLRPGESIILRADVAEEAYKATVNVQMKSAEMNVLLLIERGIYPYIWATIAAFATFYGMMYVDDHTRYLVRLAEWGWLSSILGGLSFLMFFVTTYLVGFLTFKLIKKIQANNTPVVAWRFFELQWKVYSVDQKWNEMKPKLRAATD